MDIKDAKKIIKNGLNEHKRQTATERELQLRENKCLELGATWAIDTAKELNQKEYFKFIDKLERFKQSKLPFSAWKNFEADK